MRVIWGGEEKMPLPIPRVLAAKDGCPVFQASESPLKDTIDVSHKNYLNFKKIITIFNNSFKPPNHLCPSVT
jgi:hypothetical protein